MLPFFLYERHELKKIGRAAWGSFFWVALFGGVLGTMFITKALFHVNFVNLSIVVLIQKLQPIFALILAWIVLKEKLPKRFWTWAVLAIVATYVVTFDGLLPNLNTGEKTIAAALYALGAAFAWGSSTTFSKMLLGRLDFKVSTFYRFLITVLVALPFLLLFGKNVDAANLAIPSISQFGFLALIAVSTGMVALLIYYKGLAKTPVHISTILELTFPFVAILLDFIVNHTVLSLSQWIAAIVLVFSIYKIARLRENINV